MVMHTKSGGDLEVMGIMQGKVRGDTFYILDAISLPVEGTETRVNAAADANEYLFNHIEDCERVNRPEGGVGWYHSHPGYKCWLSGIDVDTQMLNQKINEPFVAIVIDPKRTMSAGKVEIGCFRTYSEAYIRQLEQSNSAKTGGDTSVPLEKIEEMGAHFHKYYQLECSFFKTALDNEILNRLWNEYWLATLSSSPLLSNQKQLTNTIVDINSKMQKASGSSGNTSVGSSTKHFGQKVKKAGRGQIKNQMTGEVPMENEYMG
jgi:COP9 signalosome complex subunit 5